VTVAGAYGDLLRLGRAVVTTREAAARWGVARRAAGQRLDAIEQAGLARRLRRGLWALDPEIDPFAAAPYLTAPNPAYVSLWSALHHHGLIEQIPRRISLVSLGRSRTIETTRGLYEVHHIAPELFTGYAGSEADGYLASAEKALFDAVYLRAAAGRRSYFPELTLPPRFDRGALRSWIDRIPSARLRTLASRRLDSALANAAVEG
jgi:predicted transcriptional regulator of viral defense system